MYKRLNLLVLFLIVSLSLSAQWSEEDSVRTRRMLNTDGEIRLNPNAIRQIDFGTIGEPLVPTERPSLQYDETLPTPTPQRGALGISLRPYNANTPFNYNPVYKVKIKVDENTWKSNPFEGIGRDMPLIYTNWAQNWMDGTPRNSLEEIEAAGVRQVMGAERRNGVYIPTYQISPVNGNGINLGGGKTMVTTGAGGTIGGMDLMKPFTREFWSRGRNKRRERTLEVLKHYGDSTTVIWNEEIIK